MLPSLFEVEGYGVGLEATEEAIRAAMSEERGAKWYVMSGCKLELSLLSCGEGGESER